MPETVRRRLQGNRVDQVDGVARGGPGFLEIRPGEYFLDVQARSRVVNNHLAIRHEPGANDEVPIALFAFASKKAIGNRSRDGDIPGEMIPYCYFEYLRTRRGHRLAPVFEHNALNIVSLA